MAYSEKQVLNKINRTIEAWQTLRPNKSFAGMTFAQFKATVKPALDARVPVTTLRNQLKEAVRDRQEADVEAIDACLKVVNAVRGDVEEGENSALYKALGYVPKNERRSGLHRRITVLKNAA